MGVSVLLDETMIGCELISVDVIVEMKRVFRKSRGTARKSFEYINVAVRVFAPVHDDRAGMPAQ